MKFLDPPLTRPTTGQPKPPWRRCWPAQITPTTLSLDKFSLPPSLSHTHQQLSISLSLSLSPARENIVSLSPVAEHKISL